MTINMVRRGKRTLENVDYKRSTEKRREKGK